jgi:hypothetical protein
MNVTYYIREYENAPLGSLKEKVYDNNMKNHEYVGPVQSEVGSLIMNQPKIADTGQW